MGNINIESMKKSEKEIDLKRIFQIIKRRIWIVFLLIIISTSAGTVYSYKYTFPIYQSSARIILQGADAPMIGTLSVIIKDSAILDKVINELDLNITSETLAQQISVQSDSQIVTIFVIGYDPIQTSKIVNSVIHVFQNNIGTIMGYNGVKILSEAELKENLVPINQNHLKMIIISFAIGLVLGMGLVLLLESLDDTIGSEREIENILGIPVLGSVSKIKKNSRNKKKSKQILSIRGKSFGSN